MALRAVSDGARVSSGWLWHAAQALSYTAWPGCGGGAGCAAGAAGAAPAVPAAAGDSPETPADAVAAEALGVPATRGPATAGVGWPPRAPAALGSADAPGPAPAAEESAPVVAAPAVGGSLAGARGDSGCCEVVCTQLASNAARSTEQRRAPRSRTGSDTRPPYLW